MQPRVLFILCLLVAAVSARQASLSEPTPHMARRMIKFHPRLLFGASDNSGSSNGDSSSESSGSDTGSGSETDTGSGSGASNTDTVATQSATRSATSATSTSAAAPTSTSSSTADRNKSTSYQSTFTASNTRISSSTDAAGSTVVITQTLAQPTTSSTSAAIASSTESTTSQSDSSGGHTGLIIGVSVVGGVALIGALIFLWMKFGGKRFSDYQDEDADIKWPELKADGDAAALQPLPARRTGGAGFDMGDEFDDGREGDSHSMADYGNKSGNEMSESTTALNAGVGAGGGYAGTYGSGMEGNYHEESPGSNNHHYTQSGGVSGYYDPYSGYAAGQTQQFYPDQMHDGGIVTSGQQYENYPDYHNQSDPYAAARGQTSSVSPPMQPYQVRGQSMHQGY